MSSFMNQLASILLIWNCCYVLTISTFVQVDRPLGVSLTKKVFYNPETDFTCLDGSKTISFSYVNDDYCDCPDGSDEPGTSACPNGLYHCTNAGYHPKNIPSSRVNDGICDCCDGSDEWQNEELCSNTCTDLWRAERALMAEQMEHQNKGYEVRKRYSAQGVAKKTERQNKIKEISTKLQALTDVELTLKSEKDALEAKEKAMVTAQKRAIAQKKAEESGDTEALEVFAKMDHNNDGILTVEELVPYAEYDPYPADEIFTTNEAKTVLTKKEVDMSEFVEIVWPALLEKSENSQEVVTESKEHTEDDHEDIASDDDDEEDFDDDEDFDDEDFDAEEVDDEPDDEDSDETDDESNEYDYDEDTLDMIAQATNARNELKKVTDEKEKLQKEVEEINKGLKMDFGPDECFQALQHQCFEYITSEYKYKLCPFERTTQAPKKGGSETPLGRWGRWAGPPENIYSKMMYENGQGCWNGPNRSTEIILQCGVENKVTSVDEPSRCKYVFEFSTPCACVETPADSRDHDEL